MYHVSKKFTAMEFLIIGNKLNKILHEKKFKSITNYLSIRSSITNLKLFILHFNTFASNSFSFLQVFAYLTTMMVR